MHRCLNIDEIARAVASHGGSEDFAAMARTCHAFYEPAPRRQPQSALVLP